MRIMLATAHPYLPEIAGGAQSNMHEIAVELTARGHQATVLSGLMGTGRTGSIARLKLKLSWRGYVSAVVSSYRTYRAWFPWKVAYQVASAVRPDVVIVQSGLPAQLAAAFRALKIPVVLHFHNVEEDDLAGIQAGCADAYVANSRFTAQFVRDHFGIDAEVIVPSFDAGRYMTTPTGNYITFINPHPNKGVSLMLKVVENMPEQTFLFVRAWTLSPDDEAVVKNADARLPNLTVIDPVSDMREVYRQTRILAVPSVWEEAWGRVSTEAQFSGIPVVASNRGGIPEAIGPGGIVMPTNSTAEEWVKTLTKLSADNEEYDRLSMAARHHAARPEIDLDAQIISLLSICNQAIERSRTTMGAHH